MVKPNVAKNIYIYIKKTLQGKHVGAILNCLVVFIASEMQICITIVYLKEN